MSRLSSSGSGSNNDLMNTDWSAKINNATSDSERSYYESMRNQKIDAMNNAGTNTGGYNKTYNYSGSSGSNGGSFAGYGGTSGNITYTDDENLVNNILAQMNANSKAWHNAPSGSANTVGTKEWYAAQNQALVDNYGINAVRGDDGIWYYNGGNNGLYDTALIQQRPQYPQAVDQSDLIRQYYEQAQKEALLKSQYATESGVRDLQNVLTNALPSYQTARDQSALETAKNLDNQALRSALQGDTGGLANKQYSLAQSAGSERLQQINLEQRNLENTTAQAVADLQAQGRYQEAAIVAQNAQAKIQALIAEKNRLYEAAVNQYKYENDLAFNEAQLTGNYRGQDTLSKIAMDNDLKQQALSNALARLNTGIFTATDAELLGIPADQAKAYADRINTLAQLDVDQARAQLQYTYQQTANAKKGSGGYSAIDIDDILGDGVVDNGNTGDDVIDNGNTIGGVSAVVVPISKYAPIKVLDKNAYEVEGLLNLSESNVRAANKKGIEADKKFNVLVPIAKEVAYLYSQGITDETVLADFVLRFGYHLYKNENGEYEVDK